MTAARTSTAHIACFLYDERVSFVIIFIDDKTAMTVGNSNTIPNVRTREVKREIYEVNEKVLGMSGLT